MARVKSTYGTMYYVADMKAAINWYRENLGIEPHLETEDWTEFSIDGHSLCLHLRPPAQAASGLGILIVEVEGLADLVRDLKSKSVKFESDIKEVHPGAFSADFYDSEGNLVSLYENLTSST